METVEPRAKKLPRQRKKNTPPFTIETEQKWKGRKQTVNRRDIKQKGILRRHWEENRRQWRERAKLNDKERERPRQQKIEKNCHYYLREGEWFISLASHWEEGPSFVKRKGSPVSLCFEKEYKLHSTKRMKTELSTSGTPWHKRSHECPQFVATTTAKRGEGNGSQVAKHLPLCFR